ncbi:hypothetical protein CS542_09250 [Pedobacter sp. IW39]|nr:hypothetical protein CS542_09250 [Pedobacter sp. IW39]
MLQKLRIQLTIAKDGKMLHTNMLWAILTTSFRFTRKKKQIDLKENLNDVTAKMKGLSIRHYLTTKSFELDPKCFCFENLKLFMLLKMMTK